MKTLPSCEDIFSKNHLRSHVSIIIWKNIIALIAKFPIKFFLVKLLWQVARLRSGTQPRHHRLRHDHQDEHLRHLRRLIHSGDVINAVLKHFYKLKLLKKV